MNQKKRYSTDENLSERKVYQSNKQALSKYDQYYDRRFQDKLYEGSDDALSDLMHYENQVRSRYDTCYNDQLQQTQSQDLGFKVKNLMKGLKELIKELCLTKNSTIQVQEELQKLISYFLDTLSTISNDRVRNQNSSLENISQIRVKTTYQILNPSIGTETPNDLIGTKFFNKFLEGTHHEDDIPQLNSKLNSYQKELFEQFMQKFLVLLQKQINRISRYNGQKKLKYLLETVMRQIFAQLMRFTYEIKIDKFKRQKKNPLNQVSIKSQIFSSVVKRVLDTKRFVNYSFQLIKNSIKAQTKSDSDLVKKFEIKINYLDNLMKIKHRKQLRDKFLQWRKNAIIAKQIEKQQIYDGISSMIRQILYQFALNQNNFYSWNFIVWGELNKLVQGLCKFGQCILFSLQDQFIQNSPQMSPEISKECSRVNKTVNPYTYRYSNSSGSQESLENENYQNQRKLLDLIHDTFSHQEIQVCLKTGQIVMNNKMNCKLILVPVKSVNKLIGVKFNSIKDFNSSIQSEIENGTINIGSFYNILSAIQIANPLLIQIMHLKEKFEYFSQKIISREHHKFILKSIFEPKNNKIPQKKTSPQQQIHEDKAIQSKKYSIYSQVFSLTHRTNQHYQISQSQFHQFTQIDHALTKMHIRTFFVYHKNKQDSDLKMCLGHSVGEIETPLKVIGQDIAEAIFTELQKINSNQEISLFESTPRSLHLKKSSISFYAYPIFEKRKLVGFVEIHFDEEQVQKNNSKSLKIYQDNYIIETLDMKNEELNQRFLFTTEVIVPLIFDMKLNQSEKVRNQFTCQYCKKYASQQRNLLNNKSIKNAKYRNREQLNDILNQNTLGNFTTSIYLKHDSDNRFYHLEKSIYQTILENIQTKTQQKWSEQSKQNKSLLEKNFFIRNFYLEIPKSKDKKQFTKHLDCKQSQIKHSFYCFDIQNSQTDVKKKCNLNFIDFLKLYDYTRQTEQYKIEVPISKVIQVYKLMVRNPKKGESICKNDYQLFIEEILKSVLLNQQPSLPDQIKKYHSLELWFYQLEHLEEQSENEKVYFTITIHSVFSILEETSLLCTGLFQLKSNKLRKNQEALQHYSKSKIVNKLANQLSSKSLGKIMQFFVINNINTRQKSPKQENDTKQNKIKTKINQTQYFKVPQLGDKEEALIKNYLNGQQRTSRYMFALSFLQQHISIQKRFWVRKLIVQKFVQNRKAKNIQKLNKMINMLERNSVSTSLNTKQEIFRAILINIKKYIITKSEFYAKYSLLFERKMSQIFIKNKLLKFAFNKIKNQRVCPSYQSAKSLEANAFVLLSKKFAVQRFYQVMRKVLLSKESKCYFYHTFESIKQTAQDRTIVANYKKEVSIYKMQSTIKKIICKECYFPYFTQLERLEKSLYQNISLIGTQIAFIHFYSIYNFLRFLNERISIIVKSQKRLIAILYGIMIENAKVYMRIQNVQTEESYFVSLSESDTEKIRYQKFRPTDCESKVYSSTQTQVYQSRSAKIFFVTSFFEQTNGQSFKENNKLTSFKVILKKIFENNIASTFQLFFSLLQKKVMSLSLTIQRIFKISTHFSVKKNDMTIKNEDLLIKKYVLRKLQNLFVKIVKIQKIGNLEKQVERKSKQLQQLQSFYDQKNLILTSLKTKLEDVIEEKNIQHFGSNIVTKGMIKALKQNIENLSLNSENLSIQYQIKSKTVSGYQMLEIAKNIEKRQMLADIVSHLSDQNLSNRFTNRESPENDEKMNSQQSKRTTYAKIFQIDHQQLIMEEKEKVNYLKASMRQEKSMQDEKLRKASICSMARVIKGMSKNTYKKTFFRINSYSCLNSPKVIR